MKIACWNIRQGGAGGLKPIGERLRSHQPDIIVLLEFRQSSCALALALVSEGWTHVQSTEPEGKENGVCVLARTPLVRHPSPDSDWPDPKRWIGVDVPDWGFGLIGLYLPGEAYPIPRKQPYWRALLAAAERRKSEPLLLIGDLNTGAHYKDEADATFCCATEFETLGRSWVDAWRHFHSEEREYSWFGKRKGGAIGNGYRIDHAFVSQVLLPRLMGCNYSHQEREAGMSDHSVLLVEIGDPLPDGRGSVLHP